MLVKQTMGPRAGEIIDMPVHIAKALLAQGRVLDPTAVEERTAQDAGLVASVERHHPLRRKGK